MRAGHGRQAHKASGHKTPQSAKGQANPEGAAKTISASHAGLTPVNGRFRLLANCLFPASAEQSSPIIPPTESLALSFEIPAD